MFIRLILDCGPMAPFFATLINISLNNWHPWTPLSPPSTHLTLIEQSIILKSIFEKMYYDGHTHGQTDRLTDPLLELHSQLKITAWPWNLLNSYVFPSWSLLRINEDTSCSRIGLPFGGPCDFPFINCKLMILSFVVHLYVLCWI